MKQKMFDKMEMYAYNDQMYMKLFQNMINIINLELTTGNLMSFHSLSSYSQPQNRLLLDKSNSDQIKNRQKYRNSPEIRYHSPYQRLARRKIFSQLIKRYIKDEQLLKLDNFALFDAVCKRGGFQYVVSRNRWEQISICLQYQKKLWGFLKYYQDNFLHLQTQLMHVCGWYKTILYENQILQMHLITANNLTTSYYHMTANQYMFAQANYFSLDQYFNIKTLALTNADCSKISVDYAEKYVILKKWMLFSGQIKNNSVKELKYLGIQQFSSIKVVIVGISTITLLMADKLSDFGLNIVIFDKGKKQARLKDDFQIVENGLMLLQGGVNRGSYYKNLQNSLIVLGQVQVPSNGMMVLDEDGKPYSQQKIRISQQHFISIIEQLKGQIMSKKNLYQQVVTRMIRRKLQYQRFLIRWHYDRYMTFNRIKGDGTTVGDLATYQSKKFIKHIAQTSNLNLILSIEKLLIKLKQKKNVAFLQNHIDHISHQNDLWSVNFRSQTITANHLIYADQQTVFKGVLDGNPKLPEINSQIMGEALGILQQLTVMKYINCLFRFRQKILLKQPLKNQLCFSICCAHGFIYFFVLNGGTQIMAILKCYHNSNINYYSQILNILESKCLLKNNRLVNEELYAYQYTFGVKDEKYMQAIIRIKQIEKLYLLLPITTTNCPHRMTATIDMANYICSNILDEVYPNYHTYDHNFKNQFQQKIQSVNQSSSSIKTPQKQQSIDKGKKQVSLTNISTLQLSKNQSQEIQKIRFISVVANQNIENNHKIIEGQIPSIFALSQIQQDWFGLKHPLVKRYQQFIKGRIQKSNKPKYGLTNIHLFSLTQPVLLYPGTYLHSIGNPYLKQSQWYSTILSNLLNCSNYIFCLNGLITRRQYISLFDTFRTTIYYQTILIIHDQIYYCIVDQNCTTTKYYHKNLTTLISIFNKKLDDLRAEQLTTNGKTYNNFKVNRCKFQLFPPKQLMSSILVEQIQKELESSKEMSLDQLLQKKLQDTLVRVKYQKYMGSEHQQLFSQKNINSFIDFHKKIYKELTDYLTLVTKIYELKPFTLFDIFFGILDQQYIACEIMKKFTKQPLTYFDLQKLDQPLSKEIQEIFSKNISNQIYSIIIIPEQPNVLFHRNFVNSNRSRPFQRYTYMRNLQSKGTQSTVRHYLVNGALQKLQFTNKDDIIREIIRKLTLNYHQEQIVKHFQILIHKQIENQVNLSPRVKMYFRMVKKSITQIINNSSLNKFQQKCKDFDENQKRNTYDLMKRNKIRWVDNQLIFVVK